jgi:alkylhydroperoxidase family enzyme
VARIAPVAGAEIRDTPGQDALDLVSGQAASIFGHRPPMMEAFGALQTAVLLGGTLPPRLKELVRLRIAFHNQCRTCMAIRYAADTLAEGTVCSLERPAEAPDLTGAEREALRYADLMATNHLAIDDAAFDRLREHFDEGEIVELGMVCGLCVGFGRLAASWDMVDHLPDSFQTPPEDGRVTPWGHEAVVDSTPSHLSAQHAGGLSR